MSQSDIAVSVAISGIVVSSWRETLSFESCCWHVETFSLLFVAQFYITFTEMRGSSTHNGNVTSHTLPRCWHGHYQGKPSGLMTLEPMQLDLLKQRYGFKSCHMQTNQQEQNLRDTVYGRLVNLSEKFELHIDVIMQFPVDQWKHQYVYPV